MEDILTDSLMTRVFSSRSDIHAARIVNVRCWWHFFSIGQYPKDLLRLLGLRGCLDLAVACISQAYKNAMFELPVIDLPRQFVLTGAHNTLYLSWVSPYLTSINPDLHAVVQKNLLILARKASVEHVKSRRRYSESPTHSSVEEDMVPHKPPRREWKTGSSKSS